MNEYFNRISDFQEKFMHYVNSIFRTYGKELVLRLEEYNLLQNKHNCIESSTAIGFVLEEFLVSKLEMFTHCTDKTEYVIDRFSGPTASESYDCFSIKDNIKFLVNVKAEKKGASPNTAIAAIEQLHRSYCNDDGKLQQCFILFKVKYSIRDAYEDDPHRRAKPRHIYIDDLTSYALETVNFSKEWMQDNRQWSSKKDGQRTKNNGRLQVSPAFIRRNTIPEKDVSFQNTCKQLDLIWHKNEQCWLSNEDLLKILKDDKGTSIPFVNYKGYYEPQLKYCLKFTKEEMIEVIKNDDSSTYTYRESEFIKEFSEQLWKKS